MPRANIYIRESDSALFEQAQADLGENLSAMFVDCIRERLARKTAKAMNTITLSFLDDKREPNIKKSFTGRWIIGDELKPGMEFRDDWSGLLQKWTEESEEAYQARKQKEKDQGKVRGYSVAITERGQIAVFRLLTDTPDGPHDAELHVFKTAEKVEQSSQIPHELRLAILRHISFDNPINLDI